MPSDVTVEKNVGQNLISLINTTAMIITLAKLVITAKRAGIPVHYLIEGRTASHVPRSNRGESPL